MSFGRKGLNNSSGSQTARAANGFGAAASPATATHDPYAAQREAFLAEERARREDNLTSSPIDLGHHSSGVHPTGFVSNYVPDRSGFRAQVSDWTDRRFGLPHQRRTMMAYLLLFMLAPASMHRFYCGEFTKGMAQVGLFVGGLVFMVVFPPLGIAMLAFRGFWVFFDFLMIPGMMQRLKDRSGKGPSVMV